jgi:hypothetical protein
MEATGIVNKYSFRLVVALICALLSAQLLVPAAFAEGSFAERKEARQAQAEFANNLSAFRQAAGRHMDLDLASTTASVAVTSGMLGGAQQAVITRDGMNRQVMAGDLLTASEFVALAQIMAGKSQTLELGNLGEAVGGIFSVADLSTSRFSSLVVPQGVTAVVSGAQGLHVSNTLSAQGSVIALGDNPAASVNIRAGNILVDGSVATQTELPVNLNMFSASDISNSGSVSASGTLSLYAVGEILNGGGATISGGQGVLLYSDAGKITNAGLISAQSGNVSFDASLTQNLLLNNSGGSVLASQGNINFRNEGFLAKNTTEISGGKFDAKELNVFGGGGVVKLNAEEVSGLVNISGCEAHVQVSGGTLKMGNLNLSGDPTIVNTNGDVELTENIVTNGEDLAILAQGDVFAYPNVNLIDLSSKTGKGGDLHVIAGYDISQQSVSGGTQYTVSGPSEQGGSVALDYVQIKASTTQNEVGGVVRIYAHTGTGVDAEGGNVRVGAITSTSGKASGGGIVIYADGDEISILGPIDVRAVLTGGAVRLAGADADFGAGLVFLNGTLVGGGDSIVTTPSVDTDITVGDVWAKNGSINASSPKVGGSVELLSTGDMTIWGSVDTSSLTESGSIKLDSGGYISVAKNINASSGTWANNVDVDITAVDSIEISGDVNTSAKFNAGDVNISSAEGAVNIGFNSMFLSPILFDAKGGVIANSSAGNGGTVNISGDYVAVGKGINANGLKAGGSIDVVGTNGVFCPQTITSTASSYPQDGVKKNGVGGSVSVGSEEGKVEVGSVLTTAPGGGGSVVINGMEVIVHGGISTDGRNATSGLVQAGSVQISAQEDLEVNGAVSAQGANGGEIELTSNFGQVIVRGSVNSSGSLVDAGDVSIFGGLGVAISSDILTQGQSHSGNVAIDAGASLISVGGNINTSGRKLVGGIAPGRAGDVEIGAGSGAFGVLIKGSVLAQGGAGGNGISGADGGNVTIYTNEISDVTHKRLGGIEIGGSVQTQGGFTSGDGGDVKLKSGTVQIRGANSGASINTLGAKGMGSADGDSGTIVIETSDLQPLPVSFDLASVATSEYALPGALFEIGVASVNGTAGALVAGGAADTLSAQRVVGTKTQGKVSVKTSTDTSALIEQDGGDKTINLLVDPLNPNSARTKVTPAQSLALYQVTRGITQTIGLTGSGAASNLTMDGSAENRIEIPGAEFIRPMTAFNIGNAVAGHEHEISVSVILSPEMRSARLQMSPTLKNATINGNLSFVGFDDPDLEISQIDLGATALTIGANGTLASDNNQSLKLVSQTNLTLINNGQISSPKLFILLQNGTGNLNIQFGPSAQILGDGDEEAGVEIQARLGKLNIQNVDNNLPGSFKDIAVDILADKTTVGMSKLLNGVLDISGPVFEGTSTLTVGAVTATVNVDSSVKIVNGLAAAQNVVLNVSGDITFSGAFIAAEKMVTITALHNIELEERNIFRGAQGLSIFAGTSTTAGSISDANADESIFLSDGKFIINGRSSIVLDKPDNQFLIGSNVLITSTGEVSLGGGLSSGTPVSFGIWPYTNYALTKTTAIKKIGGITISGSDIQLGDEAIVNAYGGGASFVALSGSVDIGDDASFRIQGGNLSILAANNVDLGSGGYFTVNGMEKGGGGGIEVVAGSTVSTIVDALKSRPTPPQIISSGTTVDTIVSTKGIVNIGPTVTLEPNAAATEILLLNGVVKILNQGPSTSLTVNTGHFFSASKVAYSSNDCDDSGMLIVDTGEYECSDPDEAFAY